MPVNFVDVSLSCWNCKADTSLLQFFQTSKLIKNVNIPNSKKCLEITSIYEIIILSWMNERDSVKRALNCIIRISTKVVWLPPSREIVAAPMILLVNYSNIHVGWCLFRIAQLVYRRATGPDLTDTYNYITILSLSSRWENFPVPSRP
jgi:hypothetical protein